MIKQVNAEFNDRDSLIEYLERSASGFATLNLIRSEADMEELAERNGILYIPRKADNEDDLDDEEAWEEEETCCGPDVPPTVDNREDDVAAAASTPESVPNAEGSPAADNSELPPDPIAELQELVELAKYGDDGAVEKIRRILDDHPALWQTVGDLAEHAEQVLITIIADGNTLVSESMQREIKRLKDELAGGDTPTPLERMTIQRIVACWLMCQYTDRATLAADAAGTKAASWGKRQESAEKRYQLAIKSLDLVRRLKPAKKTAGAAGDVRDADRPDACSKQAATTRTEKQNGKVDSQKNRQQSDQIRRDAGPNPINRIQQFVREAEPVA